MDGKTEGDFKNSMACGRYVLFGDKRIGHKKSDEWNKKTSLVESKQDCQDIWK
jgi:hypothetical protein